MPNLASCPTKRSGLQSMCSLRRETVFVEAFLPQSMRQRLVSAVSLVSTSLVVQRLLCHGVKAPVGCFAAIDTIDDAEASLQPSLARRLLLAVSPMLSSSLTQRLLCGHRWCEHTCRLFRHLFVLHSAKACLSPFSMRRLCHLCCLDAKT